MSCMQEQRPLQQLERNSCDLRSGRFENRGEARRSDARRVRNQSETIIMEAKISSLRHNPLLERAEVTVNLEHEGEPTPSEEDVKDRLAAEEDWDADSIEVETIKTGFGQNSSVATLKLNQEIDLEAYENKLEEDEVPETSSSDEDSSSTGTDYEDLVSGTISEAKDALNDMEEPDFEAALEAEKENKNRTTLVDWLESRLE